MKNNLCCDEINEMLEQNRIDWGVAEVKSPSDLGADCSVHFCLSSFYGDELLPQTHCYCYGNQVRGLGK